MSLFITSLNSGSNGNCYYIGNQTEAVLIDAGISCSEMEKRMQRLGLSMEKIKAIFVSHEHSDHITGIPAISKKYRLPVYITTATFQAAHIPIEPELIRHFTAHQPIVIGSLSITAFPKMHDAADPHSFVVSQEKITIGVLTDIGTCCLQVIKYFKQCHAVFLESNYCEDLLEKGRYPYHLKQRIRGPQGHLSNSQALELLNNHKGKNLSQLILSHLSQNNNSIKLVETLFTQNAGNIAIKVASRYKETPVFTITESQPSNRTKKPKKLSVNQLSLFG